MTLILAATRYKRLAIFAMSTMNSRNVRPSSVSAPLVTTRWRVTWALTGEPFLDLGSSSTRRPGPRSSRPW